MGLNTTSLTDDGSSLDDDAWPHLDIGSQIGGRVDDG
jgi:hypothetical protein